LERKKECPKKMLEADLAHHAAAPRASLGAKACTSLDFTWLLVILTATHLFLNAAPLNELAETTHRLLDRFTLTQRQFDHSFLLRKKDWEVKKPVQGYQAPNHDA
jgi:hypothetical protein